MNNNWNNQQNLDWGNPYQGSEMSSQPVQAAFAADWERSQFIRRTYGHLAGGIALFIAIETLIFTAVPEATLQQMLGWMVGGFGWLIVLGAFMAVSWIARSWAESSASQTMQYAGLGLYVLGEAVLFVPLLWVAQKVSGDLSLIRSAGIMTAMVFGGLTAVVFMTKADLSGLGKYLWLGGLAAMGAIVCSIFMGTGLGTWFSVAMIVLAAGYILYDTSNVMHHYRTDQYVAASLALFASVAILFWYILRLVIAMSSDD